MISQDPNCFKPTNLLKFDKEYIKNKIFGGANFPLLDERLRILHEIASVTLVNFDGEFSNVIERSGKSAVKLLYNLTSLFNNF